MRDEFDRNFEVPPPEPDKKPDRGFILEVVEAMLPTSMLSMLTGGKGFSEGGRRILEIAAVMEGLAVGSVVLGHATPATPLLYAGSRFVNRLARSIK